MSIVSVSESDFDYHYQLLLKHLRLQGLRPKTIAAYARGIRQVGAYVDYRIDALTEAQLTEYFHGVLQSRSASTAKHHLYGLRFYYRHVLHQSLPWVKLGRTPRARRLPNVVTVDEAQRIFQTTRVLSYRVFYFTLYSLGLRLSEGLGLQLGDIDAVRARVHIRDAKGGKDRFVPLPATTLDVLRRFWQTHRNPVWIFPSRQGGASAAGRATRPLDRGGIQATLRKVAAECGIKKRSPPTACATATPRI